MENIKLPIESSSTYGDVDGLSLQNLFYTKNGQFPSCYMFNYNTRTHSDWTLNVKDVLKYLKSFSVTDFGEEPQIVQYFTKMIGPDKEHKDDMALCVIFPERNIYARFDSCITDSYILFLNDDWDMVSFLASKIEDFYERPSEIKNTFFRLCCGKSGYYLDKGKIKAPENFNINELYNDSFNKEDEKIQNFIKTEDKSGLVILHGPKGTGKSTYIKHLASSNPERKFVFVPANLISMFGDPAFGSFLSTLNNHVIVLEDCENVIKDRKQSGSASAVSLLLNMTDGILSDDLGIKFICTFNDDMKNIDSALLRKGRLISKYEFKPLETEKANKLLLKRGINEESNKPLSLADIFYYNDDDYNIKKIDII